VLGVVGRPVDFPAEWIEPEVHFTPASTRLLFSSIQDEVTQHCWVAAANFAAQFAKLSHWQREESRLLVSGSTPGCASQSILSWALARGKD
jgi:hypothetical protein